MYLCPPGTDLTNLTEAASLALEEAMTLEQVANGTFTFLQAGYLCPPGMDPPEPTVSRIVAAQSAGHTEQCSDAASSADSSTPQAEPGDEHGAQSISSADNNVQHHDRTIGEWSRL